MRTARVIPLVVSAAVLTAGLFRSGAESQVACKNLPDSVKQAARREMETTAPHTCSIDRERGRVLYELSLVQEKKTRDLTFDSSGNLLETEQQIDASELPAPVAAALNKSSGTGAIVKIEALTRQGSIVSYEASIRKNGKVREVAFSPDGTSQKPE